MRSANLALFLSALVLSAHPVVAAGGVQYNVASSQETPVSHLIDSHPHLVENGHEDYQFAMRALMAGEEDFMLTSHLIAANPANTANMPGLYIIGMIEETESYVPVVRTDSQDDRGNTELLNAISAALGEVFSSSTGQQAYMAWFHGETELKGSDFSSVMGDWPTPTEGGTLYRIIEGEKEMVACMYDQGSPMSRLDESAEIQGYEVEISRMVVSRMESHYSVDRGIDFRAWNSGGEFEAVEDLRRADTCDFVMASMTNAKAVSKGMRGGAPYHIEGIVLMASAYSPPLDNAQGLFVPHDEDAANEFDRRWIAIAFLSLFIIYQLVRRN